MGVRREHAAVAATAAFTFVAWAAIWHVDSFGAFETPIQYIWDSLFAAGATKSYADRGLGALVGAPNPWLGAPFEAQWIDFPIDDALEGSLPVGAGVFQLPAAVFPEGGRAEGLPDYEPFRLYIHSHRRLRFSYGMMKGRPDAPWHLETAHLPPPEMLARLRGTGFHAVVLATAAYPPARIAEMRAAVGDDVRVIVSEDGEYTALLF